VDKDANHGQTLLVRLAALWKPSELWSVTPSIYYQSRQVHDISNYWPIYSNPGSDHYVDGDPNARATPDKFYLPALKIEADFDAFHVISNTSYYHRTEQTGYEGTLYNLASTSRSTALRPRCSTTPGPSGRFHSRHYQLPLAVDHR